MVAEVLKQRESAEQAIDMLCDQLTKVKIENRGIF